MDFLNKNKMIPLEKVKNQKLAPIRRAALNFCLAKKLSPKTYHELARLMIYAAEEQENIQIDCERAEAQADMRLQNYCRNVFGLDAFDTEPLQFPLIKDEKLS
jgi:hypothetical protein